MKDDAGNRLAKLILELRAAGRTTPQILDELRTRCLTTRDGRPVTDAMVDGFLRVADAAAHAPVSPKAGGTPAFLLEMMERPRGERPSVIYLAKAALGDDLRYQENGELFLRENGRWGARATLDQVIRAANRVLKAENRPQIAANPAWCV